MEVYQLAPNMFVGAQITPEHLDLLAREGFTDIVCNRPDVELSGGPVSAIMAARAAQIGLGFHYLPIAPGGPVRMQSEAIARLTARPGTKVFAYCRSGARASSAWAQSQELMAGGEARLAS